MITAFDVLEDLMYPYTLTTRRQPKGYTTAIADDRAELSIDVPGVKAEDITVETDADNVIVITASRDGKRVIDDRYRINKKYDASTAKPRLALGVLTLEFGASEERKRKSLPIAVA